MIPKAVKHLLLLPLVAAVVAGGCKKDSGSPTGLDTGLKTDTAYAFVFEGKTYGGDAVAYETKLLQRLTVEVDAKPTGGLALTLQINFSTANIIVDTPMTLTKGDPNPYAHFIIGDSVKADESNVFCSRTGNDRAGTVTVTKWTGTEIAGTFWFVGASHKDQGTSRAVTGARFKASSFQQLK